MITGETLLSKSKLRFEEPKMRRTKDETPKI